MMKPQIQFICGVEEQIVPSGIRLTKSETGETGTATFIFINPTVFSLFEESVLSEPLNIERMELIWDNKKIKTNDVTIFFKDGKPSIIRSILIFKNKNWFIVCLQLSGHLKEFTTNVFQLICGCHDQTVGGGYKTKI